MTSSFSVLFSCIILATSLITNGYSINGTDTDISYRVAASYCHNAKVLYSATYLEPLLIPSVPICIHSHSFCYFSVAIWEDVPSSYQSRPPQALHIIPLYICLSRNSLQTDELCFSFHAQNIFPTSFPG